MRQNLLTIFSQLVYKSSWLVLVVGLIPFIGIAQTAPPSNLSGSALRTWLKTNWYDGRLNSLTYTNARRKMYNVIDNEQTGPNANQVICVYSGYALTVIYGGIGTNPTPINCEHTVPQSFFASAAPMVSDIHHLFPALDLWNTTRSNNKFNGIPIGTVTKWMLNNVSTTSAPVISVRDQYSKFGASMFEPRRVHKGNLARAIMYFYTMYPTEAGPITDVINVDTMYAWHLQDPVDANELTRNNRVQSQQGNRNPYIDYPEISGRAWGITVCSGTPSTQATSASTTNVLSNGLTLSWANNSGDRVLVVGRLGTAVSLSPTGNYSTGVSSNFLSSTDVGSGNKVLYNGVANTVTISGLVASTSYHFSIFAYCSNGNSYKTPALTTNSTTPSCSGNPSVQASNLLANTLGTTTASLGFNAGNGNNRMLVLRAGAAVNWIPTQGSTYTGNTNFSTATDQGNGNKVMYLGSSDNVDITNLIANTTYYANVYELCNASTPAYTISSAPNINFRTLVACAGGAFTQASALQASGMAETAATLKFTAGTGSNRLVVVRQDAATNWTPTDGNVYAANINFTAAADQSSGNKVVFSGTGIQVLISGLLPATRYYATTYEWCSTDSKYILAAAPTISFLTLGGTDLIISEYIENGASNRALELFNPTGAQVDLTEYSIRVYANGAGSPTSTTTLIGTLDDGNTFVISHPSASFVASATQTSLNMTFNGDDAVALFHNSTMIDLIGKTGCDPGTSWTATGGFTTVAKTLVRKPVYCSGIRVNPAATCSVSSFTTLSTEWLPYSAGTYTYLGNHVSNCGGVDISSITLSPATSPICLGSSGYNLTVNYALTGAFNASNSFVAELSNASGSFSTGTSIIGTTNSASVTSISAMIPSNTAAGTKYRIRVIATDPSTIGPNNGSDLIITNAAPNVSSLTAVASGQNLRVTWANPINCFTEVMVIATTKSSVAATPTGTGSGYTASATYGSGTQIVTNEYVVFKGTVTTITVSGLTENTAYQFKVYTRQASTWSSGIVVNTTSPASITGNLFRTRANISGNWTSTTLWMNSTDGGANFANTSSNPSSANSSILITSGSTVTITTNITIDEVLVAAGGKLIGNVDYTIGNGNGDDLIIEGTYVHNLGNTSISHPTVTAEGMVRVRANGIIEVAGATGGKGDAFANNESGGNMNGKIIYEPNSIFYWNVSSAFTSSGVEYFPTGMAPNGKPIMRINGNFSVGASTATNFNAVVEVSSGKTLTLNGTGDKNFAFGISGAGTIANNGGPIKITGAGSEFSIASITSLTTGTIEISAGAMATCNSNVAFGSGTHILNVKGTFDAQTYTITSTNITLNLQGGTIKTANPLGLDGVSGASFRNTTGSFNYYVAGNLGTVEFDAIGNQTLRLTNATAINLPNVKLSGSGTKMLNFATNPTLFGNLEISENAILGSLTSQTLTLKGNMTVNNSGDMAASCFNNLAITLGDNTVSQTLTSNSNPLKFYQLTGTKTTGSVSLFAGTTPLNLLAGLSLNFTGSGVFSDNGNGITVQQGTIALGGNTSSYALTGSLLLTQSATSPSGYILNGGANTTAMAAILNNLIITPAPTGSTTIDVCPLLGSGNTTIAGMFSTTADGPLQLRFNGNYMTFRGICNWQNAPTYFSWGAGSIVNFDRSPAINIADWTPHQLKQGQGAYTFRSVLVTGASPAGFDADWSADDLEVSGTAAVYGGSSNITIGNSLTLAATTSLVPETSTFTFNKAGAQSIGVTGGVNFNHLTLAGSGNKSLTSNINLTGDLTVTTATLLAADKTISIGGNADFAGPSAFVVGTSTVALNGIIKQTLSGGPSLYNLTLNNTANSTAKDDLTITNDVTISNNLTLTSGNISTGSQTIALNGTLSGEATTRRVWGNLTSVRTIGSNTSSSFGNLGLNIQTGATALGSTEVIRHLGAGVTIGAKNSILRQYEIHPTTNANLAATLTINYFDDELNGLDQSTLKLYRKPTSGSYTQQNASSVNTTTKQLSMSNIAAFSDWTAAESQVPLPVDILKLSAHKQADNNLIKWVVGPERGVSHYTVLRSADGVDFTSVGQVMAEGKPQYQYTDLGILSAVYYRLNTIDKDGTSQLSTMVRVSQQADQVIRIYPNPAADMLMVDLAMLADLTDNHYKIINSLGQVVSEGQVQANKIFIQNLPTGYYTLMIAEQRVPFIK